MRAPSRDELRWKGGEGACRVDVKGCTVPVIKGCGGEAVDKPAGGISRPIVVSGCWGRTKDAAAAELTAAISAAAA